MRRQSYEYVYRSSIDERQPLTKPVKYLSPATSTFIIRVSRDHYRIAWAALSFMDKVPLPNKNGKNCIFRVVRVSGTIRKAEEEAIRRAREIILRAKRSMGDQSGAALEAILGKSDSKAVVTDNEVLMLDASDDDMDDEDDED